MTDETRADAATIDATEPGSYFVANYPPFER